jgi:hypothetical protein
MTPFFFGATDRQLFGLFQPAHSASNDDGRCAALLCNPFGQEAVRTHRMYRVLADRLSRAGVDVLRFDYSATGDAPGEDEAGEPQGWALDLASAHAELLRRSQASRVVWIGARLGGTLAINASVSVGREPDRLVLWEPVIDGPGYLRELAERHIQTLKSSFNAPAHLWADGLQSDAESLTREGVGFALGDALRRQLGELTSGSLPRPRTRRCDLIERGDRPGATALAQAWRAEGLDVHESILKHDFDWLAAEALNTALVPTEAIQLLSHLVTDGNE